MRRAPRCGGPAAVCQAPVARRRGRLVPGAGRVRSGQPDRSARPGHARRRGGPAGSGRTAAESESVTVQHRYQDRRRAARPSSLPRRGHVSSPGLDGQLEDDNLEGAVAAAECKANRAHGGREPGHGQLPQIDILEESHRAPVRHGAACGPGPCTRDPVQPPASTAVVLDDLHGSDRDRNCQLGEGVRSGCGSDWRCLDPEIPWHSKA